MKVPQLSESTLGTASRLLTLSKVARSDTFLLADEYVIPAAERARFKAPHQAVLDRLDLLEGLGALEWERQSPGRPRARRVRSGTRFVTLDLDHWLWVLVEALQSRGLV